MTPAVFQSDCACDSNIPQDTSIKKIRLLQHFIVMQLKRNLKIFLFEITSGTEVIQSCKNTIFR